jgi:D-alanyl-D-alanine carboxypeptidase
MSRSAAARAAAAVLVLGLAGCFLLRYPADKVAVTGFTYEPWHFRYIGTALAAELHRTGVKTLEEFFGLPGGTVYR